MPMNGSGTPHLLVVDDDQRLRSLLQRYLAANGFRVSVAADAKQARALMGSIEFDGMVLDVMMPGESGLDLAADLRTLHDLPILMLTARSETGDRIAGLERGVDDYLAKPFEPRELMLRLNAMLRRARLAQPPANREIRMGNCIFDAERGELIRAGKHVKLTGAEQLLMKLFAANAGRAFTRALLCQKLNLQLERSVDVQVTRLRRKIEEDPRVPLYIQTVRGTGYVLVPDRVR